jgi:hypothetical protein
MSRFAVWPILSVSAVCALGCGEERAAPDVRVERPLAPDEPARVRTSVGTFEVNEKNAELLRQLIAGESVPVQFYAGADLQ